MISGIYEIRNEINGHRYIGSSVNMQKRFNEHKCTLSKNISHCYGIQNAWNKYGEQSFKFTPLIICDENMLLFYEQKLLDTNPRYNIGKCAEVPRRGMKLSNEQIEAMRNRLLGGELSDNHKMKISKTLTGRRLSEENKKNISLALMGNKNAFGYKHSKEEKDKLRYPRSDETKRKMSAATVGRVHAPTSEETKLNMSKAQTKRRLLERIKKHALEN